MYDDMNDEQTVMMEENHFYSTLRDFEGLVRVHGIVKILQEVDPDVSDMLFEAYEEA